MKKIVVIDDDIPGNRMVCRVLKNAGYDVRAAVNGVEGLRMCRQERPDLVITDLYMPEKDGLETIMALRRTDDKIRIMAISGGRPEYQRGRDVGYGGDVWRRCDHGQTASPGNLFACGQRAARCVISLPIA